MIRRGQDNTRFYLAGVNTSKMLEKSLLITAQDSSATQMAAPAI